MSPRALNYAAPAATVRRALRILSGSTTLAQAAEQLRNGNDMRPRSSCTRLHRKSGFRPTCDGDGLKERVALLLERIELANSRKISRGTGVLATIGSTAPFVGLFGTVWGIMNSFIGISNAHTTNLAVVAPGIAEALLATALGLVAAIPAVVIYNVLGAFDCALSRAPWRRFGASDAPREPRSRPRQAATEPGCRVKPGDSYDNRYGNSSRSRRRRTRRGARHQRHAVHRRDSRIVDHLHGGRAACHRGCAGRLTGLGGATAPATCQARVPHHKGRPQPCYRRRSGNRELPCRRRSTLQPAPTKTSASFCAPTAQYLMARSCRS